MNQPLNEIAGTDSIMMVSLDEISPSPYQSRRIFDEASLNELAGSIKEHGVIQPILLRPIEGAEKPYELVVGERRWRASRIAGNPQIRSIVRELTDDAAREINIIENVQRADITAMEEARSIQELVDANGGNKSEAARKIGKTEPYVYGKLALLTLPRDVQNMLEAGILNENVAKVILDIDSEVKQVEAAKFAEKLNLSASQLRARMQKHISKGGDKKGGKSESSGARKQTTFKALSSSLVDAYESLEGFNFDDLGGDDQGLKQREMLRRQLTLVRQSIAHAETALLREPPAAKTDAEGPKKPPKLSAA